MASIEKYDRINANKVIRHILRLNNSYKNQDIDPSKTDKNVILDDGGYRAYKKRLGEVFCQNRKDVNTLCGVVVTLPKELIEFTKEEQDYILKQVAVFLENRYGEKNGIACAIHHDEKGETPHLHYTFIPVVDDERRGEKVSAFQKVNRRDLKTLHSDLRDYINKIVGEPIGNFFYTGVTKALGGNISVEEIKNGVTPQTLKNRILALEQQKKELNISLEKSMKEISSLKEIILDREITIDKLNEQIKELEKEHNYTYEEEFEF